MVDNFQNKTCQFKKSENKNVDPGLQLGHYVILSPSLIFQPD